MLYEEDKVLPKRETPIIIIGNNRSGTSLLRLMLTCHEKIIIPPESHFMLWNYDKYHLWKPSDGFEIFLTDLFASTKFETWELTRTELEHFFRIRKPLSYSELVADIYIYYGLKKDKNATLWGDKNSLWVEKLPVLYLLFQKAKFVHIVRDGRDIATSYINLNRHARGGDKYFPKLPNQIEQIAELWNNNINAISKFLSSMPVQSYIEIKYEDLICANEATIDKILGFFGLPSSQSVFLYYDINKVKNYEPKDFLGWKEKLNEPLDESNIGKYKYELRPSEIKIFEHIAAEALEKYGYK